MFGDGIGIGLPAINAYMPGRDRQGNVLAGGSASNYPAGNYFPTLAAWQAQFVDYAGGNYHLLASSAYKNAGTDGKDLGADVDAVMVRIANAISGDNSVPPGSVQIVTSSLPNGMYGQPYAQTLKCSGGSGTCGWTLQSSSLAAGLSFDDRIGDHLRYSHRCGHRVDDRVRLGCVAAVEQRGQDAVGYYPSAAVHNRCSGGAGRPGWRFIPS